MVFQSMNTPTTCNKMLAVERKTSRWQQVASWRVSLTDRWMTSNQLKLNDDETEFIWLGTRQQLAKITPSPLQLKGQLLTLLKKIRDLGVIFDGELGMDAHAGNVV